MATVNESAGGYVVLTGTVEPEDHQFVSYCPELDVSSCGDTIEEALDNLGEAIEVQISELGDLGYLERVFRKNEVEVKTPPMPADTVSVSVPPGRIVRAYLQTVPLAAVALPNAK